MELIGLKLSTLNHFVAVATEKSFTKAADKLFVSQPTLSRQIQELEAELGVMLFIRKSHSVILSNKGEKFFAEATDILKRVQRLSHMFDDEKVSDLQPAILKIGYLPNFNMGKMYEILRRFGKNYPNVQFIMNQDTPMNLTNGILDGHYDLVFCISSYFQLQKNLKKELFMKNHLQIALPVDHKLSKKKKVYFSELKEESFILLERQQSPVIVDYVINQGLQNGFNLKADHYVKDLDQGLSMVGLGKGLAFLYSGMNNGTLEREYHIKIVDLDNSEEKQDILSVINKNNKNQFLQKLNLYLIDEKTSEI